MKVNSIKSPGEFSKEIEKLVKDKNIQYFDALMLFIEKNNYDVETVAALVKNNVIIKTKLQVECEDLNLLERSAKLPV